LIFSCPFYTYPKCFNRVTVFYPRNFPIFTLFIIMFVLFSWIFFYSYTKCLIVSLFFIVSAIVDVETLNFSLTRRMLNPLSEALVIYTYQYCNCFMVCIVLLEPWYKMYVSMQARKYWVHSEINTRLDFQKPFWENSCSIKYKTVSSFQESLQITK
jgi:hypothetical protein